MHKIKLFLLVMSVILVSALYCNVFTEGSQKMKVGIFGKGIKQERENIKSILSIAGFNAEYFNTLDLINLVKYQVVVIPQQRGGIARNPQEKNLLRRYLRTYVEEFGGNLIFYHDSVGSWRSPFADPIFPEIVRSVDYKNPTSEMKIINPHPIVKNFSKGQTIHYSYPEHFVIEPGSKATVVAIDKWDAPGVVCGKVGKGKVVFNGTIIFRADGKPIEPESVDAKLLINSVKWCSESMEIMDKEKAASLQESFIKEEKKKWNLRKYTIWRYEDPWAKKISHDIKPQKEQDIKEVEIELAQNETESSVIMVTNYSPEETLQLHIILPNLPYLKIHESIYVMSRKGGLVPDPLPELPESNIISVPPLQTKQLWFMVNSKELKPGIYTHKIIFEPLIYPERKSLLLKIKVWDFKLPTSLPLRVFTWDYRKDKELVKMMIDHRINVFMLGWMGKRENPYPKVVCNSNGKVVNKLNFSGFDSDIELIKKHGMILMECCGVIKKTVITEDGKVVPYGSKIWQKGMEKWLKELVKYMKGKGLNYNDWALYAFDEYIGHEFITLGKLVRRVDPKIQIFADPNQPFSLEDAKKVAPYIDIFCPSGWLVSMDECREGMEYLRKTTREIWCYSTGMGQRSYSPLAIYRSIGWKVWKWKLNGWGHWCLTHCAPYREWTDFTGDIRGCPTMVYSYTEKNGPVTSRRFEAFRDGLEDYAYLFLLDKLSKQKMIPRKLQSKVKEVLEKAPEEILKNRNNFTLYSLWRKRIAELILELKGKQERR
ncbi:MAG: hypothetical protein DRP73_01195 [Candidatus Omnitrophota bacterium]|nr:MAG: hypothetical protein DRP73_01195 [Candidatus Omnitrophota bacterium]